MRKTSLALLILVALLSLGVASACIVRSHPSHGHRHSGVKRGHHKHGKVGKQHKKRHKKH